MESRPARHGEVIAPSAEGSSWKPLGFWLFGLLALIAVIIVVLRIGELGRFAELAQEAEPRWLVLALGLQGLTYVCASSVWYAALARAGERRSLRSLVPLGIAKLFTDQTLPSGGISGTLLVIGGLARRGVPARIAMGALLVGLVSFYTAYGLAALGGLVALQLHNAVGPAVIGVAALFAIFVVGVPAVVLSLRRLQNESWLHRLSRAWGAAALLESVAAAPSDLLRDPVLMAKTTALQLVIFLLDAATLGLMLRALGQAISPFFVFGSFMVADVVATNRTDSTGPWRLRRRGGGDAEHDRYLDRGRACRHPVVAWIYVLAANAAGPVASALRAGHYVRTRLTRAPAAAWSVASASRAPSAADDRALRTEPARGSRVRRVARMSDSGR